MQAFLSGLALACISGITVLAFRHPHGFAKLFPFFLALVTSAFVLAVAWQVGVELTWSTLSRFIPGELLGEARAAKDRLRFPFAWIGASYSALVVFLWINLKLPPFLQTTDPTHARGRKKSS